MDITIPQVLGAISAGSSISVAIFQVAYYIGKGMSRLEKVEDKVEDHGQRLDLAGF